MGSKKNIDRLFQEQFKDFEATPNDQIWDSIQAKLDENDSSKKRFPIWMLYSGVAATIIIFVAMSVSLLSNDDSIERIVLSPETENLINKEVGVSDEKKAILIVNQNPEKIIESGLNNGQNITRVDAVDKANKVVELANTSQKSQNTGVPTVITSKKTNKNLRGKNSNLLLLSKEGLLEQDAGLVHNNLEEIDYKKEMVSSSANKSSGVVINENKATRDNNSVANNDKLSVQEIAKTASGFLEKNNEDNSQLKQKKSNVNENDVVVQSSQNYRVS